MPDAAAPHPRLDLETLFLARGYHPDPAVGLCVLEAVAYFAGLPPTDRPPCVCPVIGAFLRRWNDDLGDADRQRLKRFVPLVVGTRSTFGVEVRRAGLPIDWLLRVNAPAWLRLAGLAEPAAALASLPPIAGASVMAAFRETLSTAQQEAEAASIAAWDAARGAARDAARDADGVAAGEAVWYAACASQDAGSAARNAAITGHMQDADRGVVWAIGGVAREAAWVTAARSVRNRSRKAAPAAARQALEPTRRMLMASAEDLLERMIAVREETPDAG